MNINRIFLSGTIVDDLDVGETDGLSAVVNFTLSVGRSWQKKNGQKKSETSYINCIAWAQTATYLSENAKEGTKIFLEGRLRMDEWTSSGGEDREELCVVAERIDIMGNKKEE